MSEQAIVTIQDHPRVVWAVLHQRNLDETVTEPMQQAVNAGGPSAENTAWCRVQLGNLYFNSNRLDKAEQAYNGALAGYPNYLHAQAGLAMVRWAQGRNDEAIKLFRASVATVPLPQYLTALGDLLDSTGDKAGGKEQLDLVLYIYQVFEAGGVNVPSSSPSMRPGNSPTVVRSV